MHIILYASFFKLRGRAYNWENGFKVYLVSSTGFFWEFFFLLRASGILYSLAWRHFIFLSKILSAFPRSFGDSFNTSGHSNCYPETRLCFFTRSCGIRSSVLSRRPLSWKLNSLFLFPLMKKATSVFRVLANHSASFSFLTLAGDSFGLISLSTRVRLWSTDSLTYILVSSFNGQPLGPVNSNTEG